MPTKAIRKLVGEVAEDMQVWVSMAERDEKSKELVKRVIAKMHRIQILASAEIDE